MRMQDKTVLKTNHIDRDETRNGDYVRGSFVPTGAGVAKLC